MHRSRSDQGKRGRAFVRPRIVVLLAVALIAAFGAFLGSSAAEPASPSGPAAVAPHDGQVGTLTAVPSAVAPDTSAAVTPAATTPPPPARRALILATSVKGGKNSIEAKAAAADGFKVVLANDTKWDSMNAAAFAKYQVLVIGDKDCPDSSGSSSPAFAAAQANVGVWAPVVMSSGGNRVIIGTDPVFHDLRGHPGGGTVIAEGIAFAGQISKRTGAYVDLSCAYSGATPGTPVPLLAGLSSAGANQFTAGGAPCAGAIALVAQSGPTSGVSDNDLSNWECSVHNYFEHWGADYVPLAISTDPSVPVTYSARDVNTGSIASGSPYILVSSANVKTNSQIRLLPAGATPNNPTATALVGSTMKVTATITKLGSSTPIPGQKVAFKVAAGPNTNVALTRKTQAQGQAIFPYKDTHGAGQDVDSASYTDNTGALQQATAKVTWFAPTCPRTTTGAFMKLLAAAQCAILPAVQNQECAAAVAPLFKPTSAAATNVFNVLVNDKLFKNVQLAHKWFIQYSHLADMIKNLPALLQPLTSTQKLAVGRAMAAISGLGPCTRVLEAVVPG
jgi:hypothetical protein